MVYGELGEADMSVEGLWSVIFKFAPEEWNAGVVIFESQKIYGGDSAFYFLGGYELKPHNQTSGISAEVSVEKYIPGAVDIFGLGEDIFTIDFEGNVSSTEVGGTIRGTGEVVGKSRYQITVSLTKRAELP